MNEELKPCIKCGSKKIDAVAFSYSSLCVIKCLKCGYRIELDIPFKKLQTVKSRDNKCYRALKSLEHKKG